MEEDYKRRVLSLIMDISFSVLLILFCFYTFIFGNVSLIAIVLRILIVSMGIYIPYNKYVKKKINGIVYFIFLFLGVVIAIGCLRGNEVFNYSECYQIIFQYLTGFICIIIILRIIYYVKKNWMEIKYSGVLVIIGFIVASILGMMENITITGGIFLLGIILMFVSDDMVELIQLKTPTSKVLDTEKYSNEIKVNLFQFKVYVSILFALLYIILLCANALGIKDLYKSFVGNNAPAWIGYFYIGISYILIILLIVIVIIAGILYMEKKGNSFEKISKDLIYPKEIKEEKPKILEKIAIGKEDIDGINPEVFVENRKEIPKDIYILLSKVKDRPAIRNLLIIYPNKEVYRCKFSVGENITRRITEVELVDPQTNKS